MRQNPALASQAGRNKNKHTGLTITLGALTAFGPFATDMYLSSFQAIADDFQTQIAQVQLSLSTFFIGMAIGQLIYGPLIDKFGRKKPLIFGVLLFTLCSILALVAPDIHLFNGLRFFQAVGGCAGMIISRAIIKDLFDEQSAAQVLSVMMIVQSLGPILAPILGGYLFTLCGWQSIFIFMAGFGVLCLYLTQRQVPESLPPEKRVKNQTSLLKAFSTLLIQPSFIFPTLAGSFSIATMFIFISSSPFVFMKLFHVSQQWYGWLFAVNAIGMVLASQINNRLLKLYTVRTLIKYAAPIGFIAGLALFALRGTEHLVLLMIPLFICVSVVPVMGANTTAMAMESSGKQAGLASSLIGFLQFALAGGVSALVGLLHDGTTDPMCGMILAVTALCSLLTFTELSRYRRQTQAQQN
ncbi:Bicyclomycin resistance protein [Vibrio aerogenes CECT 7868]|uniref:Bcr/CflA family efflux transporter n=1 Tax=Vibrio aerogenes CECT 7868 TaxID=1216006 RepID=A0A1M6BUB4_9VIBR|nr:multidrug effflux MFS transporter [Vibrio aerogenes]SHI52382.1 Bicyclomycin resistance protein [Vibrio aerogenes CECT 7868]